MQHRRESAEAAVLRLFLRSWPLEASFYVIDYQFNVGRYSWIIQQAATSLLSRQHRLAVTRTRDRSPEPFVLMLHFCTAHPHFHGNGSAMKREHLTQS
jgi:hypothetical protein